MPLAKPNYAFQKRQRELAKKQKKEEKRQRKVDSPQSAGDATDPQPLDHPHDSSPDPSGDSGVPAAGERAPG